MKNAIESTGNRADHMGERINELTDRNLETIRVEEERELLFFFFNVEILLELSDSIRKGNISVMGVPKGEEREKGSEGLFKEIMAENFPNPKKKLDIQVHEAKRIPNYLNAKRPSPRHIILKLVKSK